LGDVGGFVEEGVGSWSKAVVKKFRGMGGEILFNAKVKKVLVENGAVNGVLVDTNEGEKTFVADKIVSNIPAQQTFDVIDAAAFPAGYPEKVKSMYGYGSYAPYIGLNKLVMPEAEAKMGIKIPAFCPNPKDMTMMFIFAGTFSPLLILVQHLPVNIFTPPICR